MLRAIVVLILTCSFTSHAHWAFQARLVEPRRIGGNSSFGDPPRGNPHNRIAGGVTVSPPNEFPATAFIRFGNPGQYRATCAGAIVAPKYVVTTAVCSLLDQPAEVVAGEYDIFNLANANPNRQIRRSVGYHYYGGYDVAYFNRNIVVIELDGPFALTAYVGVADLSPSEGAPGDASTATGWGGYQIWNQYLQKLALAVVDDREMNHLNPDIDLYDIVCAKANIGTGMCHYDAASPLYDSSKRLLGLYVFRLDTTDAGCTDGEPSGFVSVPYYRHFIQTVIPSGGQEISGLSWAFATVALAASAFLK